jgi:acyl-CoA synthetase (AMP-forming)/AMP-acid ligase II
VLETYGLPEAAGQVTANPLRQADRRAESVGLPVGVEVRVVDNRRERCAPGEDGWIEIRGPGVISHYLDVDLGRYRPARAADGWLVTCHAGRLDRDGFLHLTSGPLGISGGGIAGATQELIATGGGDSSRSTGFAIPIRRAS